MTDTEIKKLQSYLKELRRQHMKEAYCYDKSKDIIEPEFVGKNLFSLWWLIRKKDFTIEQEDGDLQCSFPKSAHRTIVCKFKGIWCKDAISFHDRDIDFNDNTPPKRTLNQIYYSALLSPTISKSDIIKIYELDKLYNIDPHTIDIYMIDKIISGL